jgi:hypothetical protein
MTISNRTGQPKTGRLAEERVIQRLKSLGLAAHKPIPDLGVDIEAHFPQTPNRIVKIQVKGRCNTPRKNSDLRHFQIRVSERELETGMRDNINPDQLWIDKVNAVDFFVLDAIPLNEMWVFHREKIFDVIQLNDSKYIRKNNIFIYDLPLKTKQKELDLNILISGDNGLFQSEEYKHYLNNFDQILNWLKR